MSLASAFAISGLAFVNPRTAREQVLIRQQQARQSASTVRIRHEQIGLAPEHFPDDGLMRRIVPSHHAPRSVKLQPRGEFPKPLETLSSCRRDDLLARVHGYIVHWLRHHERVEHGQARSTAARDGGGLGERRLISGERVGNHHEDGLETRCAHGKISIH